ncbi:unnamed protein product [Candida verbasci]|uniref:Homoserine kinase n=1 Tax=Candida verbasci TaxID=1227364 RepID=A0A9W4U181_9ASCO|nr:unnamed protein product [Candida verbasci]
MSFEIKVPASSANIGPGFDVLGISLNLYLTIRVEVTSKDTSSYNKNIKINYQGNLAEKVPLDANKNLITQTALYILRCNNIHEFPKGTEIFVNNPIPLGRGLGSSASAIVGGIILGNEIGKLNLSKNRLLDYCLMIERHPDNIAPTMLGGFIGSYLNDGVNNDIPLDYILPTDSTPKDKIVTNQPQENIGEYLPYNWNKKIKCITIIPNFEVSTDLSRSVLPDSYSRLDVVYNLQRISTLITSLTLDPPKNKLIYQSMKDKIHQPYRFKLIPGLNKVLENITTDKFDHLCGICLSGAGPTVLVLATGDYELIANEVIKIFNDEKIDCDWKVLDLAYDGATVNRL